MPVKVRRMKRRDIAAVVAIIKAHDEDDGRSARREFRKRARSRRRWHGRDARYYVAVNGETIAGVCGAVADDEEGEDIWWLGWFYVGQQAQGQGVGRILFERSLRWARKRGGRKLFIDTGSSEAYSAARRFYQAMGGVQEGCLMDYYEPGDNQVIYGLPL